MLVLGSGGTSAVQRSATLGGRAHGNLTARSDGGAAARIYYIEALAEWTWPCVLFISSVIAAAWVTLECLGRAASDPVRAIRYINPAGDHNRPFLRRWFQGVGL